MSGGQAAGGVEESVNRRAGFIFYHLFFKYCGRSWGVGQIRETVNDRMLSLFQAMCRSLTGAGRLFGEVTWKTRYRILRNRKDNPMGNMYFYTFF